MVFTLEFAPYPGGHLRRTLVGFAPYPGGVFLVLFTI